MSDENNDELRATKLIGRENGPRLSHRQMTTSGRGNLRFEAHHLRFEAHYLRLISACLALQYGVDYPVVFKIDDELRILPSRDGRIADGGLA